MRSDFKFVPLLMHLFGNLFRYPDPLAVPHSPRFAVAFQYLSHHSHPFLMEHGHGRSAVAFDGERPCRSFFQSGNHPYVSFSNVWVSIDTYLYRNKPPHPFLGEAVWRIESLHYNDILRISRTSSLSKVRKRPKGPAYMALSAKMSRESSPMP